MTRQQRQSNRGLALFLLLSMALALAAPAGAWQCDTGQACRVVASGCCCPEERGTVIARAASSPRGTTDSTGCSSADTHSCCMPGAKDEHSPSQAHSLRSSLPTSQGVAAAPHCRCRFALSERPESAVLSDVVRIASVAVLIPVLPVLNAPSPPRRVARSPRDEGPPERRPSRTPLGPRAPPASLSCC